MKKIKKMFGYFSGLEIALWILSAAAIIVSGVLVGQNSVVTSAASILGVTSLIFNAKGNPIGQLLMVIFSVIYGVISYTAAYYGEMITYLGMTAPMALLALITWLKNPYKGNKKEVAVNKLHPFEFVVMPALTVLVTAVFYLILTALNTANIILSTISVATSFAAVYLTARRSPYFALGYAANDIVLIAMWMLAALENSTYISVIICFSSFLVCDIYGFISWKKMQNRQSLGR